MPNLSASVRRGERRRGGIGLGRGSNLRSTLTWLILIAFTWQSFLTQTHIHISRSLETAPILYLLGANAGVLHETSSSDPARVPHDKYPANEDPANCPICQEIMHAGQFVTPTAVLLVLPSEIVFGVTVFIQTTVHFGAPSHSWQSRAPPQN